VNCNGVCEEKTDLVGAVGSDVGNVPNGKDLSDSLKIRYQEATKEDRGDFMCAVVTVIFGACNSVRLL
jgi:hypothetical protein